MEPVIGVTTEFYAEPGGDAPRERSSLLAAYSDAIFAAGGIPRPLVPPPRHDDALLDALLAGVGGVMFTGGPDLDPSRYGQPRHPKTRIMHARREAFELDLFRRADEARIPILAICLGCQVACVARGGTLIQHLDDLSLKPSVVHSLPKGRSAFHTVRIDPDSHLATIVGSTDMRVNSRHHQAPDPEHPERGLRSVAFAPDGLLEGSEDMDGRFLLAVQWHPENLTDRPEHLRLFEALVKAAAERGCRRAVL